jgi:hypothetical protein
MKRSLKTSTFALLAAAALAACSSDAKDDTLDAVPEQAAFQLGVTDDPASEGTATSDDAVDPADEVDDAMDATSAALDVAPELARNRRAIAALNAALRSFMQPIVALVRNQPPASVHGDVRTWGPVTRGATEFEFVLRHGTARHYGWLLEARPAGASDAFTVVAAGGITLGYAPRRGRGSLGLDLDALGAVDPTVSARGKLLAGFAHVAGGSVIGYRLANFTPDAATGEPIDALAERVHLAQGVNRVRLAFYGNLPETATAAAELVLARVRHEREAGGRADMLVTGGDVADGHVLVVNECWDKLLASGFRSVRDCPADGLGGDRCELVASRGDESACTAFAGAELPPLDPNAAMPDAQSVAGDVTPPEAMPDGTPPSN